MIKVGEPIPAATLQQMVDGKPSSIDSQAFFAGKKVVLFAVPGAFTPTCSAAHLPGFVVQAEQFKAKGVDAIICLSVNDVFVMAAWGEAQNADAINLWADGGATFTRALGLDMDTGDFGGIRSQRYAMVVDDGIVTHLAVEAPKTFEVSSAEAVLAVL